MADIRINALATTAASTASDDFVAVDGSANGTRKLNAFSPTFGGNLTVSGGTITGGASGMSLASGGTNQNLSITPSGTGRVHIAKSAGQDSYIELAGNGNTAGTSSVVIGQSGADLGVLYNRKNAALSFGTNGTEVARFFANGNLFVGASPVDGGQKLQVAGTAYIGSATTTVNPLTVQGNGPNTTHQAGTATAALWNRWLNSAGTRRGYYGYASAGDSTFTIMNEENGSFIIGTNSTTALTLDSSQNATFAGNITVNGAGPYTLKSRTIINRSDNTSATFGHLTLTRGTGAGNTAALATTGDTSNGVASFTLQISDTDRFVVTSAGTVVLGTQAALATNATDGFTYIPVSAGAPTGTPTAYTGKVAMEYDTTNNKLYIYNGGWKSVTLA